MRPMRGAHRDPILLLHGQPGAARDWEGVRAVIGERAETIAFDRPGWDGRREPRGLAGNAQAAATELDAVGVDRAVVVGHSFGGAVAAWLAADRPDRVAALVLVAPSANVASLNPLDHVLATPVLGDVLASSALAAAGAALSAGPLRRPVAERLSLDERYLQAAGRRLIAPATWRTFMLEQRTLMRELPTLEERLGAISAPTTIVIGTEDPIVPRASAHLLASQIPGAELVEVERANHLLPQIYSARVAEIIVSAAER